MTEVSLADLLGNRVETQAKSLVIAALMSRLGVEEIELSRAELNSVSSRHLYAVWDAQRQVLVVSCHPHPAGPVQ